MPMKLPNANNHNPKQLQPMLKKSCRNNNYSQQTQKSQPKPKNKTQKSVETPTIIINTRK
jgi:hypothetical protein